MDGNKREYETHVLTKFIVERLWFVVLACMNINPDVYEISFEI